MIKIIAKILRSIADKIDSGDVSSNPEETEEVMRVLKSYTDKEVRLSKYLACLYLNMSRASFDNYVKSGKLPKGIKQLGFRELSWTKKALDSFIKSNTKIYEKIRSNTSRNS